MSSLCCFHHPRRRPRELLCRVCCGLGHRTRGRLDTRRPHAVHHPAGGHLRSCDGGHSRGSRPGEPGPDAAALDPAAADRSVGTSIACRGDSGHCSRRLAHRLVHGPSGWDLPARRRDSMDYVCSGLSVSRFTRHRSSQASCCRRSRVCWDPCLEGSVSSRQRLWRR